jgi:teichuronic acid biosynthesis glycosyltransferase TuaC
MSARRLRVLVLSDLFPQPVRPAFGIFVERQTSHTQQYCDHVVVSPFRIFPPLSLVRQFTRPAIFRRRWQQWQQTIRTTPFHSDAFDYPVYYPHYTSPPHQMIYAMWGLWAYPMLLGLLRQLHTRYQFDLIHCHYANPAGVIGLLARRWMQVPVVVSVHGADVTYTARQNAASAAIIRRVFQQSDGLIANSQWTARLMRYHGAAGRTIEVIRYGGNHPNGIEVQTGSTPGQPLRLLTVGYLEARKGHRYLLEAVHQLLQQGYALHWTIVGDGEQRALLEQLAHTYGIGDRLSFVGYKAHQEVWPYFAGCDIFALPSWNEAFGIVYIEALGMGKPIIGCAGEGGPEELRALGNCIELVQPRDVASLVAALKRLIDNPQRRQQLATTGRQIVQQYFNWEHNASETFALYQHVLHTANPYAAAAKKGNDGSVL